MPAAPNDATPRTSRRDLFKQLGGTAAAFAFLAAAGPLATASPAVAAAAGPVRTSNRVRKLLTRLTIDEKISLVHGATDPQRLGQAGYLPGVERLGIPELRLTDGPAGVNVARSATGLPPVSTLGATFNPHLARDYGAVMGREGRTLGMDVLLAPQIELSRTPLFSRNKDQAGEDPYLNALIGVAQVEGVQAQGMLAQAKHFLANNQSVGQNGDFTTGKGAYDFRVDDRTLHEIYLPAWEAVVRAGVASVMAAYNHLNGQWNSENKTTLTGILRGELGFDGFVTSDWGATHSVSIDAGLDMQMPDAGYFGTALKAAIAAGTVPQAALDTAVGRILGQYDAFGMLDSTRVHARGNVDVEAGARVARAVATQGAVLLANDGGLPLSRTALRDLALIGPTAAQVAISASGERAYGFEERMVGPLDALRRTAGHDAHIRYAAGLDLTGTAVPASAFPSGLTRTSGTGAQVPDRAVDFTGGRAFATGSTETWTGDFTPPTTGEYALSVQGWGAALGLSLDGTQIVTAATSRDSFVRKWSSIVPTTDGLDNGRTSLQLTGGRTYALKITATGWAAGTADRGPVQVRFAWVTPEERAANIREAAALARTVHTPVVFAYNGAGGSFGGASETGSLALPDHQDELIAAVAAANPRTVLVLNTGTPNTMPWRRQIGTILRAGYVGQEGGWATADLLLGRANPSGRLTVTYPKQLTDHPAHAPGHPERYLGVNEVVTYSEGIFTGYRGFDKAGTEPLFPFGHGLSYTEFGYGRLSVRRDGDGLAVSFTVTNRGRRSGAEVPQVYLGAAHGAPVEMAVKSLAGFERVELDPGESRRVTARISERQLSYWDTVRGRWVRARGERPVYVGASSRDIRLTGTTGGSHGH
ncbi:glycoside hydrolase family 3 protein [Streptomyces beijiangensis]|uniref:Glycoside hydrolase family 3 C-terminal domain-containing protein n=2 Tax=Streptomyces beijiangensis TaxID=163361 RepID=A0A939F0R0_9ACTN|nr:glycoside hydrolase family 3 C-terminal domain-containing protein [Streptomyces beijiangensis]MBO0510381.1 glycoside hydrolase family 3 C-terminal domain-containing protein [Streptomyces beijiangensis]